mmetsp:Transcript_17562/g.33330  ORF Transcript_17562/g.33330 Transcript_17562/m.33330 type:complete len:92 (+) Transcript_17562:2-277(+)
MTACVCVCVCVRVCFQNGWSALMYACDLGHTELALHLLEEKADINLKSETSCIGYFPKTALSIACAKNNTRLYNHIFDKLEEMDPDPDYIY